MAEVRLVALVPCKSLSLKDFRWQLGDVSWEVWLEDLDDGGLSRDFLVRLAAVSASDRLLTLQIWAIDGSEEPLAEWEANLVGPDDAGGAEAHFHMRGCPVVPGMWYDAVLLLDGRWLGSCYMRIHEA